MTWSQETEEALQAWLAPDTAHDINPHDNSRFYDFIFNVWIDEQGIWDEALAKQKMKQKAAQLHPVWSPQMIAEFIDERRSEGTLILDFLSNAKEKGLFPKLK
ncbi:MAG: hypothetical protein JRG74_07525 [Deltaproteobacteria bacterium]|jgi:hypothetical protein|nr:hypothetical protein [Deltaproteobacteria bacterium]MBW2742101.1 hypothetical protein [Deltaproteobacteria bacterium]MDL1984628.1 hypothetical protein [Deltaproteobacteria bacterium]